MKLKATQLLPVEEIATFLPDRYFQASSDREFTRAVDRFVKSGSKVCSMGVNFESLSTNVNYLLNRWAKAKICYFYAPLKKTVAYDIRLDVRIKRLLLDNEPNVNPNIRHPLIRRRRFFKEHWIEEAENEYLIVLKNSINLLTHTRFLISNLIIYSSCKLIFLDELGNGKSKRI
jgi:hypothetical protein